MERISIFNYEAFYLDYLEGNLDEEDTRMLMQFFEDHPECRLDDEELQSFDQGETAVYKGKSDLKQVSLEDEIATENVEHFLIAEAEGILNEEKTNELNAFVLGNPKLENERSFYQAVYFEPDDSLVYAHKEDLKQKKSIVLWPYIAIAAAAAIIAFVLLINGTEVDAGNAPDSIAEKSNSEQPVNQEDENNNAPVENPEVYKNTVNVSYAVNDLDANQAIQKKVNSIQRNFDQLKSRPVETILSSVGEQELVPVTRKMPTNSMETQTQPVLAVNEMSNPIEPVTNFISKKTNTDVDFGRRESTQKKKGGFFVKIGNFSFERNKH